MSYFAPENIPARLRQFPTWLVWRKEVRHRKETKIPFDAKVPWDEAHPSYAKTNDPTTWTTFDVAAKAADPLEGSDFDGVGFVLHGTPIVGFDFDGVVDDGVVEPYVLSIIALLKNAYCEITPSEKGMRAFVECAAGLPKGNRKFNAKKPGVEKYGAEIYSGSEGGRYLTCSGAHYSGKGIPAMSFEEMEIPYFLVTRFPDEKFKRLWTGDASDYENDDSRVDLALCGRLLREFKGDLAKAQRFFSASVPGHRDKWLKRADYREATWKKVQEGGTESPSEQKNGKRQETVHPIIEAAQKQAAEFDLNESLFDPAKKYPERKPIFKGFLTEADYAVLIAAKKAEKSLFGLRWAMHIACGKSWCGYVCPRPRRVAYLDGENDRAEAAKRYNAIIKEFSAEEQPLIRANLVLLEGDPYIKAGGSLDYLNDRWWDYYLGETKDCEVHFLDCLYLLHSKEAYDNTGLKEVLDVLRYRINTTGPNRTTVLLHHSRSMSNDDLRQSDKLSLARLGPEAFSEKSYGGKVLLKIATLVVCLDKIARRDADGEVESQEIHCQFFGRSIPTSPLLQFEEVDETYGRQLIRTPTKRGREAILNLYSARGENHVWRNKSDAARDIKGARSSAFMRLDELIAKGYLVADADGRLHLVVTPQLRIDISRLQDRATQLNDATRWLRDFVTKRMEAENVIALGDEQGFDREILLEARAKSGLVEETITDEAMHSRKVWRPKRKRGVNSAQAKKAANARWNPCKDGEDTAPDENPPQAEEAA